MNYDTMTIESLANECFEQSGYKINKSDLESRIKHLCEKYHQDKLKNESLHVVSDCEIDNLLSDLDKDATDYNGYEYGLPICGEWLVTLRTTVRTWLNK